MPADRLTQFMQDAKLVRHVKDDWAAKMLDPHSFEFKQLMLIWNMNIAAEDWCVQFAMLMNDAMRQAEERSDEIRKEKTEGHEKEKAELNSKQQQYDEAVADTANNKDLALKIIDNVITIKQLNDEIKNYTAQLDQLDQELKPLDQAFRAEVEKFNAEWKVENQKATQNYIAENFEKRGENHVLAVKDGEGKKLTDAQGQPVEIIFKPEQMKKLEKTYLQAKSPADLLLHNPFVQMVAELDEKGQPKSREEIRNLKAEKIAATQDLLCQLQNARNLRSVYQDPANKNKIQVKERVITVLDENNKPLLDEHGNKVRKKISEAQLPEKIKLADDLATSESTSTKKDKGKEYYQEKHANLFGQVLEAAKINNVTIPVMTRSPDDHARVADLAEKNEPRAAKMRERENIHNKLVDAEARMKATVGFVDAGVEKLSTTAEAKKQAEAIPEPPPPPPPYRMK